MTDTDRDGWDEYDRLRSGLTMIRDALREEPDTRPTLPEVASWLDQLLWVDVDPLQGPLAELLASETLAAQALLYVRPRVALQVVDEIADVVAGTPMRCPVHDNLDCSPLLNGCQLPTTIPASVAAYIRSAKDSIQEEIDGADAALTAGPHGEPAQQEPVDQAGGVGGVGEAGEADWVTGRAGEA